jgi:hypothetical protein
MYLPCLLAAHSRLLQELRGGPRLGQCLPAAERYGIVCMFGFVLVARNTEHARTDTDHAAAGKHADCVRPDYYRVSSNWRVKRVTNAIAAAICRGDVCWGTAPGWKRSKCGWRETQPFGSLLDLMVTFLPAAAEKCCPGGVCGGAALPGDRATHVFALTGV